MPFVWSRAVGRGNTERLRFGVRPWASLAIAVSLATVCCTAALAKPPVGRKWPASRRVSMNEIDHSAYDALLRKYVDSDGYVNYRAWQRSSADRRALQEYLGRLGQASRKKDASRAARLAFWINAYNALTLEGILQVYPTSSIRNHTAKLFGYNIWDDLPLIVGDDAYSLNHIEHKILRKMGEPRIHFAIVCASVGCPRLLSRAYTAEKLDKQLALNAKDFFSRRKNFRADAATRTIYVSSILKWFAEDFGETQVARFKRLRPYLPAGARPLATDPGTTVRYLDYDWSLNDQARRSTARAR